LPPHAVEAAAVNPTDNSALICDQQFAAQG
jgi:hypothetical protein